MRDVGLLRWLSVGFLVAEASALAGCEKRPDTGAAAAASVSVAPSPPAEPPRLEITLASGQNHPFSVVVDKGYVYWVNDDLDTDSGTVLRVAINGGTPTVIASSQYELSDGGRIAVYGGNVYWIRTEGTREEHENSQRAVVTAPVGGGPVRKIAATGVLTGPLAVDASGVHWIGIKDSVGGDQGSIGALNRVSTSGGKVTTLAVEPTNAYAADVLLDAQYVYWSQLDYRPRPGGEFSRHVVKAPREGGTAVELAAFGFKSPGIHALVIDDTAVYVADAADGKGPGTISAVPKSGGAARTLASVVRPWALAGDSANLYVVVNGKSGLIARISKATGDALVLAADQLYPGSIAVDDSFVYWTNFGEGTTGAVKKIRK